MGRSTTTEAVVLRSFRFGEADRVLHLYTLERGRVGAVAKGVRRTKSRFGARLEPFSHVELVLHLGRGELDTVTGASLLAPHDGVRTDPYRLRTGLIGLEAMLRLFTEQEANERAFTALTRFLDALDEISEDEPGRPSLDPLVLSFQLKLLWLSGYLPHLESCVECGATQGLAGYAPAASGAVCRDCSRRRDPAVGRRPAGYCRASAQPAGRGEGGGTHASRCTRRARGRHRVVRVPRWLSPPRAVCLMRG